LTRCRNGLHKRPLEDLAIRIVGHTSRPQDVARLVEGRFHAQPIDTPEVEILFLPGEGRFSGRAECNVLVALDSQNVPASLERAAHLKITPESGQTSGPHGTFTPERFAQALAAVA